MSRLWDDKKSSAYYDTLDEKAPGLRTCFFMNSNLVKSQMMGFPAMFGMFLGFAMVGGSADE